MIRVLSLTVLCVALAACGGSDSTEDVPGITSDTVLDTPPATTLSAELLPPDAGVLPVDLLPPG